MVVRIRLEGKEEIVKSFKAKPAQIRRAAKRSVTQTTNTLHKELGGAIPRAADMPVGGYRRVRAKKRRAKAARGRVSGSVWMGTRKIAAAHAGRLRNDPARSGAWAGKYFFENSFVAKMGSGYESVFQRIEGSNKIKQRYVHLPSAAGVTKGIVRKSERDFSTLFTKNLKAEIAKSR